MAMTLRLNENEQDTLERIKEKLGCSTASATLKKLILNYEKLSEQLEKLNKNYAIATQEIDEVKTEVNHYFHIQKKLTDMVHGEAWHKEIIGRIEAHEAGHSVTYSLDKADEIMREHINAVKNR